MGIAASVLVLAGLVSVLFTVRAAAAPDRARSVSGAPVVRQARVLEVERTGVASPAGLAFSPGGDSFYVVDAKPEGASTEIVVLTPFKLSPVSDRSGSVRIAAAVSDPVNMVFDRRRNRLLLLDAADRLLEVHADANGDLDARTLVRHDALRLELRDAQGMTVDPASGSVFILDSGASRILRIEPGADGTFDAAAISVVELEPGGASGVRGLALDPSTGHLQLRRGQALQELTTAGEVVATRDLSGLGLARPGGMALAPSGDLTDDRGQLSIYVADSGGGTSGSAGAAPSAGQIVELSLAAPIAPASIDETSSLVNTVDMGALTPSSTDPSGITYVPETDRLLISDGEVEETVNGITHFAGANVWELERIGLTLERTANISSVPPTVVPMTNEPAGSAFNPTNGHYIFSADDGKKVFDVNPGADGLVGTAGDTWTWFDTLGVGNSDPEGVTYDTFGGHLFVADGLNREVYEYTTSGTLVNHFDTAQYGVQDPEAVEFNPDSGTLFILSDRSNTAPPAPVIVETTRSGALIRTIDASASGAIKPAGLAFGPSSDGLGAKSFYLVDRGIDNNADPNAIDGKLYEMTTPAPGAPGNTPPAVDAGTDQAITLPASAGLDGNVSDDGVPAPFTTTWTQVSGPSSVTFGNANVVDTTASVSIPGIYVVRLTANDGEFAAFDDVTLTFSGAGGAQAIDVRVNANPDDAEEVATTGLVQRGDADLDLMTDNSDTKLVVGMRFNGVAIPAGASITAAYVQFQADEAHSVPTTLSIRGQAADNPPMFSTTAFDLSSRPTTAASASWSPDPWLGVGDAGLAQRSGDLASVIQEIVDRPGWASSNSLVLLVTGSGRRVAVAHNQNPAGAPLLHVEWATGSGNNAPVIGSDGGGANASVLPAENQTFVTDVDATDPDPDPDTLTYSISGGADQTAFTIVPSTGVLTFVTPPDSEAPADAGGNNVYDVVVSVSDGNGGVDSQAIAAAVQNVNEFSPQITSDGGGPTAALSRPDNQTQVTDVNATDGDNQAPVYSISGGADQTAFTVVPSTGVLTFVSAPDFDAPTDVGSDNVYDVIVEASDGSHSDTQAIAVAVTQNSGSALYFSLVDVATVGGVTAENEDVVYFDGTTFSLAFDGSDVGLASFRIDAFSWVSATSLLLSFDASGAVPGIAGTVDDSDIVLFTSTSLGSDTAGTFSLYFDGSDVGLTTSGEDVDAVELLPSGHILVSTVNTASVTGLTGEDEDLLEFVPTSIGPNTAGAFSLYFEGSDVGLTATGEDVDAAAVDATGNIYLSTFNNFSVPGISGQDEDVFVFTPSSLGTTTTGTFSPTPYFDGTAFGLAANDVFAIDLP